MLTASQTRAARAILNWSQQELADASGLSLATVRKAELGHISPRSTTTKAIYNVLYSAGIEFIDPDGARRRPSEMLIFEGASGGRCFFENLLETVSKNAGAVLIATPSAQSFAKFCGLKNIFELDSIIDSNNTTEIKCLLIDGEDAPQSTPRFQFRTISKNYANPVPFCTYGQKYVIAVPNGEPFSKLITIESAKMAAAARSHFYSLWENVPQSGVRPVGENVQKMVAC
jgi:transcriptional regulator with XRE-family HTH domain